MSLRKGRERFERRTHFLKIYGARGSTHQYTGKRTTGDHHQLKITDRKIHQNMADKLEKHTHLLDRAKGDLSGHEKGNW